MRHRKAKNSSNSAALLIAQCVNDERREVDSGLIVQEKPWLRIRSRQVLWQSLCVLRVSTASYVRIVNFASYALYTEKTRSVCVAASNLGRSNGKGNQRLHCRLSILTKSSRDGSMSRRDSGASRLLPSSSSIQGEAAFRALHDSTVEEFNQSLLARLLRLHGVLPWGRGWWRYVIALLNLSYIGLHTYSELHFADSDNMRLAVAVQMRRFTMPRPTSPQRLLVCRWLWGCGRCRCKCTNAATKGTPRCSRLRASAWPSATWSRSPGASASGAGSCWW